MENKGAAPLAAYERSIFLIKVMLGIIATLAGIVVMLAIAIASILPLKSTELVVYEFRDSTKNFVKVQAAGQNMRANDALLDLFMREYVANRETVDRLTETQRYTRVIAMNSKEETQRFKSAYSGPQAPMNQKGLNRRVEITRTTRLANSFYQLEFKTVDSWDSEDGRSPPPETVSEWVATLAFTFSDQVVTTEEARFNPLGLFVTRYALSGRK